MANGKNKYWAEIRWDRRQEASLEHINAKRDRRRQENAKVGDPRRTPDEKEQPANPV
jgi:hypothetical protein